MNTKEILKRRREGATAKEVGKEFGISTSRVYQILNGYKKTLQDSENGVRDDLINRGWIVLRNGYPDFFCYNPEHNMFKFVEVKGFTDRVRPNQDVMIGYLRKAGFVVEIVKTFTTEEKYRKMRNLGKKSWASRKKKIMEKVAVKNQDDKIKCPR